MTDDNSARHPGDLTGESPRILDDFVDECHAALKHEIGRWRIVGPMREPRSPTKESWLAIDDNGGSVTTSPLVGFEETVANKYNKLTFIDKRHAIEFIHWRGTRAALEFALHLGTDQIVSSAASSANSASRDATPGNSGAPPQV